MEVAVEVDEDRLAGHHVAHDLELAVLQHERLARDDPFVGSVGSLAGAEDERSDAERVPESEEPVAGDQRDGRVGPLHPLVHARDGLEHLLGVELETRDRGLQLVGEHVHEQFGVARGVQVTPILAKQLLGEFARVRQIAVVHEHDAVGRVDVEGLRLLLIAGGALRGISDVTEAEVAHEGPHVAGAERLAHLPLRLVHVERAGGFGRRHPRGVLTAMLQQEEGVVDLLVDGPTAHHADDSAHACYASPFVKTASPKAPTRRTAPPSTPLAPCS